MKHVKLGVHRKDPTRHSSPINGAHKNANQGQGASVTDRHAAAAAHSRRAALFAQPNVKGCVSGR